MPDTQPALSSERVDQVLAELRGPVGRYPAQAVADATEHIDQLEERFLTVLAAYADDPAGADVRYGGMAPIFAAYLLAHGRKIAAHRQLLRILTLPGEAPYEILGDLVHEDMPMLLWQTSGGDLTGVLELARNRKADPYCRLACLEVLPFAWADGGITRDEAIASLHDMLAAAKEEPDDGTVVGQVIAVICDLHPGESLALIQEAYYLELVDLSWIDWGSVQVYAERDREDMLAELRRDRLEHLSSTLHESLHWWDAFRDDRSPARASDSPVSMLAQHQTKKQQRRLQRKKQAKKSRKKNRQKR